jgi:hypothetical protein
MTRRISAEQLTIPEKVLLTDIVKDLANNSKCEMVQLFTSGGLAIHGAGSPLAKIASTIYAMAVNAAGTPVIVTKTTQDLPALVGTVANAAFNVFCFFIDSTGAFTVAMGTAGATLGAVLFPTFPASNACIGFIIINPTGTGAFVGGTTNLDDGTVVPNAVFINTLGGLNPTLTPFVLP